MSVLSRSLIRKRLALGIDNPKSLVVTPLDDSALDSDSIDLRLGSHFLFPSLPAQAAIDIHKKTGGPRDMSIYVPADSPLTLPAHQTVLGVTLEFVKLPNDISGQILTKSSVARMFMVIETAPWIHPNYRGCLTLEIANVSSSALVLRPGMRIGQLILLEVAEPEETARMSGTYVGPIHPEDPVTLRRHSH